MRYIRRNKERGQGSMSWLDSRHSFSFADYYDPRHMGFGVLRVINEDRVAGGAGFPMHPHRDMEIISLVISGALQHGDSLGHEGVIRRGGVQRITAGRGIVHREENPDPAVPVHFFQIWIEPRVRGLEPSYESKEYDLDRDGLTLLASPEGRDGAVRIEQDARLWHLRNSSDEEVSLPSPDGRTSWIQVIDGDFCLGETELAAGDGIGVKEECGLKLTGKGSLLFFDLPV